MRWLIALAMGAPAWALSCGPIPSVKEAWRETPLIFAGHVERTSSWLLNWLFGEQTAWVRVTEAFKGVTKDQVIELRESLAYGGDGFQEGWLLFYVFPGESRGTWQVHFCHRTERLNQAAHDLQFLRGLPATASGNSVSGTVEVKVGNRARP